MGKPKLNDDKIVKIRSLRAKGISLLEISKSLNIPKTTVYRYIKGVEILPEFMEFWKKKRTGSRYKRILKEEMAFLEGKKLIGKLSNKEKMLFISALY